MPFDKETFWRDTRLAVLNAAEPDFVPVPDEAIADPAQRERLYREAMGRMLYHRACAVRDVTKRHAAYYHAIRVGQLWPPGAAAGESVDCDALIERARALVEQGGREALADAAALLAIAAFNKLLQE